VCSHEQLIQCSAELILCVCQPQLVGSLQKRVRQGMGRSECCTAADKLQS
jgi:hypothetical protein